MEKYFRPCDESIESIIDYLLDNSWGGARDRVQGATDEQLEQVASNLQELFYDEYVTDTTINDFVWFDCDDIFDEEEEEEEE